MSKCTKEDIIRLVKEGDVEFIRMQFTGFVRINESDRNLRPDLSTFAILPWRPQHGKAARLICAAPIRPATPVSTWRCLPAGLDGVEKGLTTADRAFGAQLKGGRALRRAQQRRVGGGRGRGRPRLRVCGRRPGSGKLYEWLKGGSI